MNSSQGIASSSRFFYESAFYRPLRCECVYSLIRCHSSFLRFQNVSQGSNHTLFEKSRGFPCDPSFIKLFRRIKLAMQSNVKNGRKPNPEMSLSIMNAKSRYNFSEESLFNWMKEESLKSHPRLEHCIFEGIISVLLSFLCVMK